VNDEAYRRYVRINLPHAHSVAGRIARTLEALGAFGEGGNGSGVLRAVWTRLEEALAEFSDDPPFEEAVRRADEMAVLARELVDAIVARQLRNERLGQHVRNLFECLGLAEEGAELGLRCGEPADSPLR
jgi:hypothetical protein